MEDLYVNAALNNMNEKLFLLISSLTFQIIFFSFIHQVMIAKIED